MKSFSLFIIGLFLAKYYMALKENVEDNGVHRRLAVGDGGVESAVFNYVGSHVFKVPDGVHVISVILAGASGGDSVSTTYNDTALGGFGGVITANVNVEPGETLRIYVGGVGVENGEGGYNGGGDSCFNVDFPGASGGGATDIRKSPFSLTDRLVVAGGGGGAFSEYVAHGGNAGFPHGVDGGTGNSEAGQGGGGGGDGGGGQGGAGCSEGIFGNGSTCCGYYGAGGGGGYYGGGGAYNAAGGGGSSYVVEAAELVSRGIATPRGNGHATLSWIPPTATSVVFATVGDSLFVVPAGVSTLSVVLFGASGGDSYNSIDRLSAPGGLGGYIEANIVVIPGEILRVFVGGVGMENVAGGYNGGGDACFDPDMPGSSGGGATDIRRDPYELENRLVVAGGGGGSYSAYVTTGGGDGGYPAGSDGGIGDGSHGGAGTIAGGGGTQNDGGSPGPDCFAGGVFGQGGPCCGDGGAGGGGGYYGGAGAYMAGGGGGSSYSYDSLISAGVAFPPGSGRAVLSWAPPLSHNVMFTEVTVHVFTVPEGVTSLLVTLYGASGGNAHDLVEGGSAYGGRGGLIKASISVEPEEILHIFVGGAGNQTAEGGFNGGGSACMYLYWPGASGGGATDIRRYPYRLEDRLVVAGGGGGAYSYNAGNGGNAGYPDGQVGETGYEDGRGGGGGNQTGGGDGGGYNDDYCSMGVFGNGSSCCFDYGAGGGGGFYGGGGAYEGGGGGGSSYASADSYISSDLAPMGNGMALLSWEAAPSAVPTISPSAWPTSSPTAQPTSQPSGQPSSQPTRQPSRQPVGQPSSQPTKQPNGQPTSQPSAQPSNSPTAQPSRQPSRQPSSQPSGQPVGSPSSQPTRQPTSQPSRQPSSQPSGSPTVQPSRQPSRQPSGQPSGSPTSQPSRQPSSKPTGQPTAQPSRQPSTQPSGSPTVQPSRQPSAQPSAQPSGSPSSQPTRQPSGKPTRQPTSQPSRQPSTQPSGSPTSQPTRQPSTQPSRQPSSAPSTQPTRQPTGKPTGQPTSQPSRQPSAQPSGGPTSQPSRQPSRQPSTQPSGAPSAKPSRQPSGKPTGQPTSQPSRQPSSQPSCSPTAQPSRQPSRQPSAQPSSSPSSQPSRQPSGKPTGQPTAQPSRQPSTQPSSSPTGQPSGQPTVQPSRQPSSAPSAQPTRRPSAQPTRQPTSQPSRQPSSQPSGSPSSQPSRQPSAQPSRQPSSVPSTQPSRQPSGQPTRQPTIRPSCQPSTQPSVSPTVQPSRQPSAAPSGQPSGTPTRQPSAQPTSQPSRQPSAQPSRQPSGQPSSQPSKQPSVQPSNQPSRQPTSQPTRQPSAQPTRQPSAQPSRQPTAHPSAQPSVQPTSHPSGQPSRQPTAQPSRQPSAQPSAQPSSQPSSSPSTQPSAQPTSQPTIHPSRAPTAQPSVQPTDQPSSAPSGQPTSAPSGQPSAQPSSSPSSQPSIQPTRQPSAQPSSAPSTQPSAAPSAQPTQQPSSKPTAQPSGQPTAQPSSQPSMQPSVQPSAQPSTRPSAQPSSVPSAQPTAQPSTDPSGQPTSEPSAQPSVQPSSLPTTQPSSNPTSDPTSQPSGVPSHQPSSQPSTVPSAQPSVVPSTQPSASPTAQPSMQPTSEPSAQPSGAPSALPSSQPSSQPSVQPSSVPTEQPSVQPSCKPSSQPTGSPTSSPSSQPSSQPSAQPSVQPVGQPTNQPSRQPSGQPSRQPVTRPSGQPSKQPTSSPTSAPTAYQTSRFIYSRSPSVNPTRSPTLSEQSSWFNDLQDALTELPQNDTDIVAHRSTYYELDVASGSPFRVYGGCSAWSTVVSGDMKPAQYTHKVTSVLLKTVVDRNSNEFSESLVAGNVQCGDPAVASSIVGAITGSAVITSRTFQCGAEAWVVRHCPVSGSSNALSPAVCVNCADPCSAVQQCNLASPTALSTAFVLAVSPCVQQQCSGQYTPATAIRILSVGYANLEEAPRLVAVSATSTRTTVQVTAQLSSQGSLSAAIYRVSAAVSEPASVNAVLLQNVAASTNAANTSTLTFQGLDTATSYRVYFLTTSPVGVKSTLTDVLSTATYIDTACCKTVTGLLSATSAIEHQAFPNILALRLSGPPSGNMAVLISLFAINGTGAASLYSQSLFPSTIYVSSLASSTTVLRASLPSLPAGTYEYHLVLTGATAGDFSVEYANSQQRIEVVSAFTEPPVPVLSSATFASDGSFVNIVFSADTNKGNTATSFACSALFDFACATTSKCQWANAATVRATIQGASSADSCARPGSLLTLSSAALIKAVCRVAGDAGRGNACPGYNKWTAVAPVTLTMSAPVSALTPTVAISAPSVLGGCDGLSLDVSGSSGSGGRSWINSSIAVSGVQNANLTALTSYLRGLTVLTPPPVIPAALFAKGTQYNFAVTLCNFIGRCGVGYKQVLVLNDIVPSVALPGVALRTLSRKDGLYLASSAFVATCDGKKSSAGLSYKWSLSSNGAQLLSTDSMSKDVTKYLLPAFSLSAGVFYQVSLSVSVAGSTQSSSASVQVFVQPGSLVAVVQGGSARTMRVADTLSLDSFTSYDEDQSGVTGLAASLQYQWNCAQVAPVFLSSCGTMFDPVKLQESKNPWYDLTALSLAADTRFEVTVTITDEARRRTASSSVIVSVLPELAPVVGVAAMNAPSSGVINAGQLLQLSGTISVPASYGGNATWTVSDSSIDLSKVALFPVTIAIASLPGAAASAVTSRAVFMAFAANSLPSGSTLTFSLVGTIPYLGKQAVGSVTITVNAPPTPGSFYVSPDSGEELSQLFQFVALNWVDPDLPLAYQFEYASSNGASVVVRSKLELSYGSFLLPAGNVESNREVSCTAQIFDALGANASSSYAVTVTQGAPRNTTEVQDFVANSLADASVDADSIKQAAALSSYLLNEVNCTLAPNCSALHRKSCLSTAHTCGVCESLLYVGEEGDSNEPCYSRADLLYRRRLSTPRNVTKSCPAGCSGHGTCVHVHADSGEVIDTIVSPCLEGDVKCLAVCDCEDAYYGSDACEFSTEQLQQRQSSRALVVLGLQTLVGLENPDQQVIGGWVSSLAQVSQVASEMTETTALSVLSLVDTVTASSADSVSSQMVSGLLSTVNAVAASTTKSALRRRLSDRRYRRLTADNSTTNLDAAATVTATRNVLNSVGALLAQSMLPDQTAAQFTQGELRMSVQVQFGFSVESESGFTQQELSVAIPQTALEQALGAPVSQVNIPRNSTSGEEVSLVATSARSEHFQYLGQDLLSNPLQLYTSAQLCVAPPCYVNVVLQNSEATDFAILNQDVDVVEMHEVICLNQDYSIRDFTCQNGQVLSLSCTGVTATVSQRCPVVRYSGACNSLSSSAEAVLSGADSGCSMLSYTDTSVTCRCAVSSQELTRRALQSAQGYNFSAPVGYSVSYVSMLSSTADTFASTILTADDLNASTVAKGWRSLATLGTLAAAILFGLCWSHHADRQAKRVQPAEGVKTLSKKDSSAAKMFKIAKNNATMKKYRFNARAKKAVLNAELQIVEDSLPRVLSSRTFSDRFLEEVKQHHRWFGIVFYFSDSFPRVLRVISLASNAIIMLFIQSITYNLTNPDDGACAALHSESACLVPKSPFATGESKCAWDLSTDKCVFVEPDNSVRIILFVAIFCAIVTTPIAMAVDWVVCNILSAPTEENTEVSTEVMTTLVPGTDASNEPDAARGDMARRNSRTSIRLTQFLQYFTDEEKMAEDKQLIAISRSELTLLASKLKSYRDKLRPDELEEFNLLWGLDAEGKFLNKTAEDATLLGRLKVLFGKEEEVNVEEAVLMDLKSINAAVRKESAQLRESNAAKYEIGKKLLFLFQCDLLPGISGKILEQKSSRDSSTVRRVSLRSKIVGYTFLFTMNVGMLFYIFLFALTQTGPKQNAWFQSFALWLVVEILLVSTAMVFFTHILVPSLVMKDLTQIKRRLMDNIRDFNEKVQAGKDMAVKDSASESSEMPFNAANFLFVSTRLARQFPDLKESKIIAQFSTPWPRQSYLRVQNVSKGYSKKFSALTRSASILIIFFVGNLLTVPPSIQDILVQITSTTAIGYLVLIHVQLYEIFPVLVILPLLAVLVLVHFIIQSSKADAQIKLARMFPAKKRVAPAPGAGSGNMIGAQGSDTVLTAIAAEGEESKSHYDDDDCDTISSFGSDFSAADRTPNRPVVALPVSSVPHRTRRQSLQSGLQILHAMEQIAASGLSDSVVVSSDSEATSESDATSESLDESERLTLLGSAVRNKSELHDDAGDFNSQSDLSDSGGDQSGSDVSDSEVSDSGSEDENDLHRSISHDLNQVHVQLHGVFDSSNTVEGSQSLHLAPCTAELSPYTVLSHKTFAAVPMAATQSTGQVPVQSGVEVNEVSCDFPSSEDNDSGTESDTECTESVADTLSALPAGSQGVKDFASCYSSTVGPTELVRQPVLVNRTGTASVSNSSQFSSQQGEDEEEQQKEKEEKEQDDEKAATASASMVSEGSSDSAENDRIMPVSVSAARVDASEDMEEDAWSSDGSDTISISSADESNVVAAVVPTTATAFGATNVIAVPTAMTELSVLSSDDGSDTISVGSFSESDGPAVAINQVKAPTVTTAAAAFSAFLHGHRDSESSSDIDNSATNSSDDDVCCAPEGSEGSIFDTINDDEMSAQDSKHLSPTTKQAVLPEDLHLLRLHTDLQDTPQVTTAHSAQPSPPPLESTPVGTSSGSSGEEGEVEVECEGDDHHSDVDEGYLSDNSDISDCSVDSTSFGVVKTKD